MGSCFCSLKIQLILRRRWESRWAVMLAPSRWPEADGWRRRGWRALLLLWPPGGISRRIMRGLPYPGQTKGPSDREMNFWRWPKAGAQECEGARQVSVLPARSPVDLPLLLGHTSCRGSPIEVPSKFPREGSDTSQIHSLAGI